MLSAGSSTAITHPASASSSMGSSSSGWDAVSSACGY